MTDDRGQSEYKFQRLQIYQLGLDYVDSVYQLTRELPKSENLNLRSQLERAATSIVLNIAQGSTGQTDPEQARFLDFALRSLIECIACPDLIEHHRHVSLEELAGTRRLSFELFIKIQAMRRILEKRGVSDRRSPVPN